MELTREEYESTKAILKDSLKNKGDFIGVYEIMVANSENDYQPKGPFTLKIKITDDMKAYSGFRLFNLNDFGLEGYSPLEVPVTIANGYIVAEVDELGIYAITGVKDAGQGENGGSNGNKKSAPTPGGKTPKTGDATDLGLYALLLALSMMGALGVKTTIRRNKQND